jgi:hypothetical protein
MKIIITILLIFINNLIAFSQTKTETQDWIKEKIEIYAYSNDAENFGHEYSVTFNEYFMFIKTSYFSNYDDPAPIVILYTIPVKEMNSIIFEEKLNTTWLIISTKDNKKSIYSTDGKNNNAKYTNDLELILYKSVNDSDMKNRFVKAFKHLVKLYGGSVVDEKF